MDKTKKVLFLYRCLCESYAQLDRAVGFDELRRVAGYSRSSTFNYLSLLIDLGFVSRPARGWYTPLNVYQYHMDDFLKGKSNE